MIKRIRLITTTSFWRNTASAAVLFTVLGVTPALAQSTSSGAQDEWEYAGAIYLWATDVGGQTIGGSEVEVGFSDIFDALEMAFMGTFAARKNEWSVLSDLIYFDLGADKTTDLSVPVGPVQVPVTTSADMGLEGWIVNVSGGYELYSDGDDRLDVVGGVRYLDLEMDLFLELQSLGPGQSRTVNESLSSLDAVIGVKGTKSLGERWSLPYYVDVGAGESAFTWQAAIGVAFEAGDRWDVALLYRHIDWDLDSTRVIDDLNFSGPSLGAIFRW